MSQLNSNVDVVEDLGCILYKERCVWGVHTAVGSVWVTLYTVVLYSLMQRHFDEQKRPK